MIKNSVDVTHEVLHLQSLLCTLPRRIRKVKKEIWEGAEEALISLNSCQTKKWLFFHFCVSFEEWKKGRLFLLCPVVNQQTKRITRIKACKLQWSYFKVYRRLEVEERIVSLSKYCLCKKELSSFILLNCLELQKVTHRNFSL